MTFEQLELLEQWIASPHYCGSWCPSGCRSDDEEVVEAVRELLQAHIATVTKP